VTALPEVRSVDELGAELFPSWDATRRRKWLYRQHEERGLPAYKVGRSLMFDTAAVADWFARQRVGEWSTTDTNGASIHSQE
jgi:hypothetical protein